MTSKTDSEVCIDTAGPTGLRAAGLSGAADAPDCVSLPLPEEEELEEPEEDDEEDPEDEEYPEDPVP